jgi:hypothetical protein
LSTLDRLSCFMGLRIAIVSYIITYARKCSIKTKSKMSRSATSPSKGKLFGSLRLHPYAQKLPIDPPRNLSRPKPTQAQTYPVLGGRSRSNGRRKSSSTPRRRRQVSEFSALNDGGVYDANNDIASILTQNIEPISYAETVSDQDYGIERREIPRPHSQPCPILPNINQGSSDANYWRLMATRQSSEPRLPPPMNYTSYDEISSQQIKRLNHSPVKFLDLADIATGRSEAQVQALLYPRECVDQDGNIVSRFVTDCSHTSGRVYDRLFRRELARINPYNGTFHRVLNNHVFDVYAGVVRRRCLFDDLRDINARNEGCLDIIDRECDFVYKAIPASELC